MELEFVNVEEDLSSRLPKRNVWADYLYRPILVTAMITCISVSIVAMGRAVAPDWWGGHLVIGMLIATIESIYSFKILRHPKSRGISIQRFRLAELGILAIVLKIVTYFGQPWAIATANMSAMMRQPSAFFTMDYIVMLILAFLAWGIAYAVMLDFEALYDPFTFRTERIAPMNTLANRFYWGGGLIVLFSGISLVMDRSGVAGLVDLATLSSERISGVVLNVVIYFLLGLLMLSQVRLTSLMTRWYLQDVQVADGLGKAWAKYGFTFLGILALIAILLPTGYSLGILDSAALGLSLLSQLLLGIAQFLLFIITLPLTLLMSLFGNGEAVTETPTGSADFSGFLPPEEPGGPTPPWYEILRSLGFWLIFVVITIYLIRTYLADHPEILAALKRFAPLRWILSAVTLLVRWLRELVRKGIDAIPKKVNLESKLAANQRQTRKRRLLRLSGKLTAREQILYYYLNMLERASDVGMSRQRSQTPHEFEPHLKQSMPEAEHDITLLTQAFVQARYSQDSFDGEHVAMVKMIWQRIQTALKSFGKRDEEKE